MNRFLRILFCLALMLLLTVPAMAEELTAGEFTYTVNEDGETVTITGSSGVPGSVLTIPAVLDGKTVTAIGNGAFRECGAIQTIIFPGAGMLTSIGESAFRSCDSLVSVTLPEGLTSLARESFGSCLLLREVHIPTTLTDAGDFYGPFTNSELLRTVTFADGLKTIPSHLFYGAWPETFDLPESLTSIQASAFAGCKNLRSLEIPEGVTTIGYQAFMGCSLLTSVDLPNTLETIGGAAFQNAALMGVTLPANLTSIGDFAFSNCEGLTRVEIPEGVTTLGRECFGNIDTLESVYVPSTLTDAGNFYGPFTGSPNLRNVTLGEGTTVIPSHLFYSAAMETITLPDTLVEIGSEAFRYCENLTSVVLPRSVTTVANNAFWECSSLATVVLSPSLTEFGNAVFYSCEALTRVEIPEGVTALPGSVFRNCTSLGTVWLPKSLESVGKSAFQGCTALTDVRISNGLTTVYDSAFRDCLSLKEIILPETVTAVKGSAFRDNISLNTVYFLGDAPQISTDSAFPDDTTLYYYDNREGWTTPYYPAANKYATCPIWGEVDLSDGDYFAKLADHHFKFRNPAGDPLTGVTVVFGEELHSSGDAAEITARFADDAVEELTFQKEGYYPVTLPLEVLEGISVIRMYPSTWDEPFIQAAYAKNVDTGKISDLINGGLLLCAGDTATRFSFYIQPNWVGGAASEIPMTKTVNVADAVTTLNADWNEARNISANLTPESSLYLLQENPGADTVVVRIPTVVLDEEPTASLGLSNRFDFANLLPENLDILSETSLGIDLTEDMELNLTLNADGTFSGFLGITLGDDNDPDIRDKEFSNAEDEMAVLLQDMFEERANLTDGLLDIYRNELKNLHAVPAIKHSRWIFDSEAIAIGYVKGKCVYNEKGIVVPYFTEIGVGLGYNGEVQHSWRFPINGKPYYASLALLNDVQFLVNFEKAYYGEILKPKPFTLEWTSIIEPRFGMGWDAVANVGVRGEGGVDIEFAFPLTQERADAAVNVAVYAEATFFCLESDFLLLELKDVDLTKPLDYVQPISLMSTTPSAQWEPQSMDYLYEASLFEVGEENTDTNVTMLASGVYPYAETQLAILPDGTELAVWVAHGDNEPNNRTRLYYSYTVDGSWTEPAPVDGDNLTADFSPLLQVENGVAYLAWQDAARPLTDSDDVTTMASVMDVSVASFNGDGFDLLGSFGTDFYDGALSLTTLGGKPAVVWACNESNDVLSGGGLTSSLHRAVLEYETWTAETLAEGLGSVDRTAAYGDEIWFTADTVGDGNPADRELYSFEGELTRLTENDVIDSKPAVVNGQLIWFRDSVLTDGESEIPMAKVTDRYQYLQNGAMEALVYVVSDGEQQSGIYASFNDGSGWGKAIALTDGSTNIGSFSARFLPDGSLAVLALERNAVLDEDNRISYSAGILNRYEIAIRGDLTVRAVDYIATTLLPDGSLAVQAALTNSGMAYARAVQVTVADGETELATQVCQAELASGESGAVALNVPLGDVIPEELTVTVMPVGFADEEPMDNTVALTLNCTDLSVEDAMAVAGDGTSVTVMVANRGQTAVDIAEVNLTDAEGAVLATQTVTDLDVRSAQFVEFVLEETLEDGTLLFAEAPELGTENLLSNNRIPVLVQGTVAGDITEELSVSAADGTVEATVVLTNATGAAATGNYLCAAYDEDGRMLTCCAELSRTILPGKTASITATFPEETVTVRLFRLDGSNLPTGTAIEKEISE